MNNINHFEQYLAQTLWLPPSFKRTLIGGKSVAFLVKMVLKLWPHFFTKCLKNEMKALNDFLNGIKLLLVSSDLSRTQLHKWENVLQTFSFWTSQLCAGAADTFLICFSFYSARSCAAIFLRAVFFSLLAPRSKRKRDYPQGRNAVKSRFL